MWKKNNRTFDNPGNYYGFIYKITDDKGKWYIGKKAFTHRKKKILSKKARKGTRKRINIEIVDSGWKEYWGSCKPLLQYIEENGTRGFRREIIALCQDKQNLAYWESYYLIKECALFTDNSWNSNILGKFFKGKILYHG